MRICTIPNCGRPHLAKGFCSMHWQRNKWGDDMSAPDCKSGFNEYTTEDGIVTLYLSHKGEKEKCFINEYDLVLTQSVGLRFYAAEGTTTFYAHAKKTYESVIQLHRLIMCVQNEDVIVDHVDGNGLNNVRKNLRVTTQSVNILNQHGLRSNNTSGHTGIWWSVGQQRWIAEVLVGGKKNYLGCAKTREELVERVKIFRQGAIDAQTPKL